MKIKLLDRSLKIPLVQGHPVVFGQNVWYIREEDYLFYLKSFGSHFMLFVKYSQFWLKSVLKLKNAHRASLSKKNQLDLLMYVIAPFEFYVVSYWWFSLHFKSLQSLVESSKLIIHRSMFSKWYVFSLLSTYYDWCRFRMKLIIF